MKPIAIGKTIAALRKQQGVTQEQLARALNISTQAVSKWETEVSLPDTPTLPQIAAFFNVSIDHLFYGNDQPYPDIYTQNFQRIASLGQMNGFEEALRLYAPIHHGLSCGNLHGKEWLYDEAAHNSDAQGLSLLSGKGYAALVTRRFFENINEQTLAFSAPILKALQAPHCLAVAATVISMSDISFHELEEHLSLDTTVLRQALDTLIDAELLTETVSKHKSLGTTYQISEMYHTCLCILLATLEMQRDSRINGITCCMTASADYPIAL